MHSTIACPFSSLLIPSNTNSYPFLSILIHSCPFLSILIPPRPFLSIYYASRWCRNSWQLGQRRAGQLIFGFVVHLCPSLSIIVHPCPSFSLLVHSCQLLNIDQPSPSWSIFVQTKCDKLTKSVRLCLRPKSCIVMLIDGNQHRPLPRRQS
jgi:hypothetical protein